MKRLATLLLVLGLLSAVCPPVVAQQISRLPNVDRRFRNNRFRPFNRRRNVQPQGDPNGRFYKPAQVIAEVGKEVVFLSDVLPKVNEALANAKVPVDQLEAQRQRLILAVLQQVIQRKMLKQEFILGFPTNKRDEIFIQIKEKTNTAFNSELPKMVKQNKVASPAELDAKLRKFGSSLAKRKQAFEEMLIAQATLARAIPRKHNVSFDELLAYYEENEVRYRKAARVRWEQLTVRFDKVANKRQAYRQIVSMGNEVRLGGAKFSAVAKRRSHGLNADKGGYHDWVEKGSLSSTKIDRVLFAIPPRLLSRIVEDSRGYHIVRVIQRESAGRVPFDKVQDEIKTKLQAKKRNLAQQEFFKKLQRKYPVWTIYDRRPRSPQKQAPTTGRGGSFRAERSSGFVPR